jgi:hypothetical protein
VGAALGRGQMCSGVAFLPKELPTCAIDDVKPTDSAVRIEGSLLPPHPIDDALKSSSLRVCLQSG